MIQPEGGKHRDIKHADAAALHDQAVIGTRLAQTPTDAEHDERAQSNADQPRFDGNLDMLRSVLEQKGDAEKQHDDAKAHQRVATEEKVPEQ